MKKQSVKCYGFTIIEMLTVTVILWLIVPSIIAIYSFMIKSNKEFNLRQTAIQQWYEFFEKLNILMQDYTIDYEEYYNRQMVWCREWWGTGENFTWNIWLSWYCTNFTAYWNENSTDKKTPPVDVIDQKFHDIYNCSSISSSIGDLNKPNLPHRAVMVEDCWKFWSRQSFGQYAALFRDVKNDLYNSYDDEDMWQPLNIDINAIIDANNIQELYLISHDWKKRLFFRRRLVAQEWDSAQYKIQILRLRWFDAWQTHSFGEIWEWSYDRQIDTWACDTSMWFEWNWSEVWWAYSGYYLPSDVDDCRVDLTYGNTNVSTWNLIVSPINDPDLYRADDSHQINPYIKMLIVNSVYSPLNSGSSITEFKIPIETTINMKSFYKE